VGSVPPPAAAEWGTASTIGDKGVTRATKWLTTASACAAVLTAVAIPTGPAGAAGTATTAAVVAHPGVWPTFAPGLHRDAVPAGAHLTYYGGPVISNMKSVDVSYGAGSFISPGHPGASAIAAFTGQLLGSGVDDWLSEYDTPASGGTGQTIGRGAYDGTVTITPSPADNGSTIQDSQIQTELNAQITAGTLPTPDADTSYAVFFPLGKSICDAGSCSLVSGGFCAYHGTFLRNGVPVTYQVMPDLTGTSGCGSSTDLNNTTSVLSHELTETITDPDVGLATVLAPPLAWYDATNGEIGDICNAQQGSFVGTDSVTYVVQSEFSNSRASCYVGTVPVVSTPLTVVTTSLAAGAVGTPYTQSLAAAGGNAPYTWKLVRGLGKLPKGVKLAKATGVLTGTPKLAGVYTFTVEVLDTKTITKPRTRNVATQVLVLTVA
jgi:hypothetical protein